MTDHRAAAQTALTNAHDVADNAPMTHADSAQIYLQEAQAHATLALAEEQLTANRLQLALIDQLTELTEQVSKGGRVGIRLRDYLPASDWARIEHVNADGAQ